MKVIPSLPPADIELADRIEKLALYVNRNGQDFERKVKEKEASNPQFEFLFTLSSEGYAYYTWLLYCHSNSYSEDQGRCLSDAHAHKINYHGPQGTLQLTDRDQTELSDLLRSNDGSKDSIKRTRKWILERAHSIIHIGSEICRFADKLAQESGSSGFMQLLHIAYVINDVLYNAKEASSNGPYTRISSEHVPIDISVLIAPYLSPLLVACCATAGDDSQRGKAFGLLTLWSKKGFVTEEYSETLKAAMESATLPLVLPALVQLVSPYLEDNTHTNPNNQSETAPQSDNVTSSSHFQSVPGMSEAQLTQLQLIHQKIQAQLMQASKQQNMQSPPPVPHEVHPAHSHMGVIGQFGNMHGYSNQPQFMPFPPQTMSMSMPPIMHMPVQYSNTPMLDLAQIPVGNMANIVKAAKRAGHPANTTIDIMMFAPHAMPHVEPGRLEARLAAFFRNMEGIVNPQSVAAKNEANKSSRNIVASGGDLDDQVRGRRQTEKRKDDEEEGWEKYVPGYEDNRAAEADRDSYRPSRKLARSSGDSNGKAASVVEVMISEDNVGHKLLRGLGWQQGSGLGAEGAGIVEPISAKGAADRSGLGSGEGGEVPTLKDGSIDYSAYRKQLSSHYYSRMSDR